MKKVATSADLTILSLGLSSSKAVSTRHSWFSEGISFVENERTLKALSSEVSSFGDFRRSIACNK